MDLETWQAAAACLHGEWPFDNMNDHSLQGRSVPGTLQVQLIATRRQHILTAAQVFAEKSFHTTSIKDIARQATR